MVGRDKRLAEALNPVKRQYEFILIDCPPSLGLLTINALSAADSVLIPVQCEYYALEGVSNLSDSIRVVRRYLNPALEIEASYSPCTTIACSFVAAWPKKYATTSATRFIRRSSTAILVWLRPQVLASPLCSTTQNRGAPTTTTVWFPKSAPISPLFWPNPPSVFSVLIVLDNRLHLHIIFTLVF